MDACALAPVARLGPGLVEVAEVLGHVLGGGLGLGPVAVAAGGRPLPAALALAGPALGMWEVRTW